MPALTIVDYGVGNLGSVTRALRRIGAEGYLSAEPETIRRSRALFLPGVGHFGESMANLRARGLEEAVKEAVASGALLLGICVGFQMLFDTSEEAPGVPGLGLLRGEVRRFPAGALTPHIGWNQVAIDKASGLVEGIRSGDYFYFLHSYYVTAGDPAVVVARTDYEVTFCSVAARDNVMGIQFHPEKSQQLGLRVLENFGRLS